MPYNPLLEQQHTFANAHPQLLTPCRLNCSVSLRRRSERNCQRHQRCLFFYFGLTLGWLWNKRDEKLWVLLTLQELRWKGKSADSSLNLYERNQMLLQHAGTANHKQSLLRASLFCRLSPHFKTCSTATDSFRAEWNTAFIGIYGNTCGNPTISCQTHCGDSIFPI